MADTAQREGSGVDAPWIAAGPVGPAAGCSGPGKVGAPGSGEGIAAIRERILLHPGPCESERAVFIERAADGMSNNAAQVADDDPGESAFLTAVVQWLRAEMSIPVTYGHGGHVLSAPSPHAVAVAAAYLGEEEF
jgi:hypothetical protein